MGNGKLSTEKGQFYYPRSIYNYLLESLIYVGDRLSVQIFWKDGVCLQRLGDDNVGSKMNQFNGVFGICVVDDRLYVSDFRNERIQVFQVLVNK